MEQERAYMSEPLMGGRAKRSSLSSMIHPKSDEEQHAIDKTQISFLAMNITEPRLDGTGFKVTGSMLVTDVMYPGATVSSTTVHLSYDGKEFGHMTTPEMDCVSGQPNTLDLGEQQFVVTDPAVWEVASKALVAELSVDWRMKGKATVSMKMLGSKFSLGKVTLDKTVPLDGLAGMKDVHVASFSLADSTETAIIVRTTVCVGNPSFVRIMPLGRLSSDISMEFRGQQHKVSSAQSDHLSFEIIASDPSHPTCTRFRATGLTPVEFVGEIDSDNPDVLSEIMTRYMSDEPTFVVGEITGLQGPSASLFGGAVTGQALALTLDGVGLNVMKNLMFHRNVLYPINSRQVRLEMDSATTVLNPLGTGSPMTVVRAIMNVTMSDGHGNLMGRLTTPWIPSGSVIDAEEGELRLATHDAILELDGEGTVFSNFLTDSINACNLTMQIKGVSSAVVEHPALAFPLMLTNLPIAFPDYEAGVPAIAMGGMCGMKDIQIVDQLVTDSPKGPLSKVTTRVHNPSSFGMYVGDLEYTIHIDEQYVGNTTTKNLTLVPGWNTMVMEGILFAETQAQLDAFARAVSARLNNKTYPIEVRGKVSTTGVFKDIPWLQRSMAQFDMISPYPGVDANLLESVEILEMGMKFDSDVPQIMSSVRSKIIHLDDNQLDTNILSVSGVMETVSADGFPLSRTILKETPVKYIPSTTFHGGYIESTSEYADMEILDHDRLAEFLTQSLQSTKVAMKIVGHSNPTVVSSLGKLHLQSLPFEAMVEAQGMDGLRNVELVDLDVLSATEDSVSMRTVVRIHNPANVSCSMGEVRVDMLLDGTVLGQAVIPNFSLNAARYGPTVLSDVVTTYHRTPENRPYGTQFLSRFISGEDQIMDLAASEDSTDVSVLKPSMRGFTMSVPTPSLKTLKGLRLFDEGVMALPTSILSCMTGYDCLVPTRLHMRNPFSIPVTIHNVTEDIFACDKMSNDHKECLSWSGNKHMGEFTPQRNMGIVLKAGETLWSEAFPVFVPHSIIETFKELLSAATSNTLVRIEGKITMQVGDFIETVSYSEWDVSVCLDYQLHQCLDEAIWRPPTGTDVDCGVYVPGVGCPHPAYCEYKPTLMNWMACGLRPEMIPQK